MYTEVTNTLQEPYAAISYLRAVWADGSATLASAVVVGENDVLTALHAVYDTAPGKGGWAKSILISPAADTNPATFPFGTFTDVGSIVGRASNWDFNGDGLLTQEESQGDLALIGLKSPIGDSTGWLPVAAVPSDLQGALVGYPLRASSIGMVYEVDPVDMSTRAGVYAVNSDLGPGASGGPLLYTADGVTSVVGILSSGNKGYTQSTYAALYGTGTMDWLQTAIAANDTLIGLPAGGASQSSPNMYFGTAGNDSLLGSAGNDVFTGFSGNDFFEGFAGTDTAMFKGRLADHRVTIVSATEIEIEIEIDVTDSFASRDGSDVLRNVERVRFADFGIAYDVNGSAGEAYRLYQAAFNRQPDLGGLGYQMYALDMGYTLSQVAANFLASPEFQSKYGSLDNQQFITLLYQNVLHRAPDQEGFDFHLQEFEQGQTRADMLTHFSESPENQALVIGMIQGGMTYIPI